MKTLHLFLATEMPQKIGCSLHQNKGRHVIYGTFLILGRCGTNFHVLLTPNTQRRDEQCASTNSSFTWWNREKRTRTSTKTRRVRSVFHPNPGTESSTIEPGTTSRHPLISRIPPRRRPGLEPRVPKPKRRRSDRFNPSGTSAMLATYRPDKVTDVPDQRSVGTGPIVSTPLVR